MDSSGPSDEYGIITFVDPSDEQAVARLFNYPLSERKKLPPDLTATYLKLYTAHQRVLLQLASAKSELARVKKGNEKLHHRYQQAMDQTAQLLMMLKGLKDEQEWNSDSERSRSATPESTPSPPEKNPRDKVHVSPLSRDSGTEVTKDMESITKPVAPEHTPASEWIKSTDADISVREATPPVSSIMASRHAPKSPAHPMPLKPGRTPHDMVKHHLGISNKASPNAQNSPINMAQTSSAALMKHEQADQPSLLPPPPARQKTVYCHCFTNCWDKDAETNCTCRKAYEPCDTQKCHKPPKRVWLPWGNPDGTPCDCRWSGSKEEEEEYGFPRNRLKKWLNGSEKF